MYIDPLVYDYAATLLSDIEFDLCIKTFELLEKFGVNQVYEKYVNLITDDYTYDKFDKIDIFLNFLIQDNKYILDFHYIELNSDAKLIDYVQVNSSLYILQDLENYDIIESIVYNLDDNETKFAYILEYLNTYQSHESLLFIKRVDSKFIEAIKDLISSKKNDVLISIDYDHINKIKLLYKFIDKYDSYIFKLYKDSFIRETQNIETIIKLLPSDYLNKLKENKDKLETVAIEILILLYIGRDSHNNVLEYFRDHYNLFINEENYISIYSIFSAMNSDFLNYLTALTQREV